MEEQPIFTTQAHVFQIDPSTENWVLASKQAVTVSYFYNVTRSSYGIINVDGAKVIINSTITPNMTFTKTSQKFGQWADSRANTVFGLGFSSKQQLTKFAEKFQESAANVTKWESELQTRLTTALQESVASVEQWKKQFSICRDENDRLCSKIEQLEEQCSEINREKENTQLKSRLRSWSQSSEKRRWS
ncbi:hypothetical protein NN561_005378 [Cricetulus griseus]